MSEVISPSALADFIVKYVHVGIFVLNKDMEILLWNNFMAAHSGISSEEVLGKSIFESFPELPKPWLTKKILGVFLLKNYAFTSWEQRPYLFRFSHNRPITGLVPYMYQNCTFIPVKNDTGQIESVCVTIFDATDIGIAQTELKEAMECLHESSNRDGLTGMYNRRYLEQRLSAEFDRVIRYEAELSFIIFDLDHFKRVNDTYGHLAGDEVLCEVSARINALLRTADVLGRYGGEEFCVILPATPLEGAMILAERIRQVVEKKSVKFNDIEISVTVSIGVVQSSIQNKKYEELIHQADLALYYGKKNGRNRVTCYTPDLEG